MHVSKHSMWCFWENFLGTKHALFMPFVSCLSFLSFAEICFWENFLGTKHALFTPFVSCLSFLSFTEIGNRVFCFVGFPVVPTCVAIYYEPNFLELIQIQTHLIYAATCMPTLSFGWKTIVVSRKLWNINKPPAACPYFIFFVLLAQYMKTLRCRNSPSSSTSVTK